MTDEQIIEMAREANLPSCLATHPKALKRFAKLVAKHTLMNVDPSKFMSFQEGIDVGRIAEREACAKIADSYADGLERNYSGLIADKIRARGQ